MLLSLKDNQKERDPKSVRENLSDLSSLNLKIIMAMIKINSIMSYMSIFLGHSTNEKLVTSKESGVGFK